MPTNEERLDREYILGKLLDVLDDPDIKTKDRLEAIKLAGEYRKLFGERGTRYDIRAIVAQLSNKQLKGLFHGEQSIRIEEPGVIDLIPESSSGGNQSDN